MSASITKANLDTDSAGATTAFDLHGCGIGVTGGGSERGSAIALGLAAAGAKVVIFGRTPTTLERVLDRIEAQAGRVSGWVNNAHPAQASVARANAWMELSRAPFEASVASAIGAFALATQAAAARMSQGAAPGSEGAGAIVNVASIYGVVSPQPGGGVSAANPDEAWSALEHPEIEVIQVAASLLDQRLARAVSSRPPSRPASRSICGASFFKASRSFHPASSRVPCLASASP